MTLLRARRKPVVHEAAFYDGVTLRDVAALVWGIKAPVTKSLTGAAHIQHPVQGLVMVSVNNYVILDRQTGAVSVVSPSSFQTNWERVT